MFKKTGRTTTIGVTKPTKHQDDEKVANTNTDQSNSNQGKEKSDND